MSEKVMTATEPDWVRGAISKHRAWIESLVGVPLEKTIILEVANHLTSLPARHIMRDLRLAKPIVGPTAKLRRAVNSIEYPEGMAPFLKARLSSTSPHRPSTKPAEWEISWETHPSPFASRSCVALWSFLNCHTLIRTRPVGTKSSSAVRMRLPGSWRWCESPR